jgi:hypothetical protein
MIIYAIISTEFKMAKKDTIIIKHILEIRLKKRIFSFLDFRGELVDFLLDKTGFERIKISDNGARIDVVSKDLSEIFFFSLENFGLQIDGAEDFDSFRNQTNKIFNLIQEYGNYSIGDVVRIGTKSSIFCHIPGGSFEGTKQKYIDLMLCGSKKIEEKSELELKDIAFTFMDLQEKNGSKGKAHITTGPATKEEVIEKFFGKNEKYLNFSKENGIYYEIDYYQPEEKNLTQEQLRQQVLSNINAVEKKFNGFLSLFKDEKDGK